MKSKAVEFWKNISLVIVLLLWKMPHGGKKMSLGSGGHERWHLSNNDAYLVTGNIKHFPKTPVVVTPAEMLEIIQRESC